MTLGLSSTGISGLRKREAHLEAGPGPPGALVAPGELSAGKAPEGTGRTRQAHCKGLREATAFPFIYSVPCLERLRGEAGNFDFIPKAPVSH